MVTKVVSIKCAEPAQAIGTTGLWSWPWLLVGDVPEPIPDSFEVLLASIIEAVREIECGETGDDTSERSLLMKGRQSESA